MIFDTHALHRFMLQGMRLLVLQGLRNLDFVLVEQLGHDLGHEVEAEAYLHGTHQDLMGENIFCESLAGEEIGRMKSWPVSSIVCLQ